MFILQWKKELECGVPEIDQQHRQVIEEINRFFIRRKCGKNKAAVLECMSFLKQYIMYHFQYEEAIQQQCRYPLYREHQASHGGLATQVKFFAVKLESADYSEASINELCAFLANWLRNHILEEDIAFSNYYKAYMAANLAPTGT